MSKDKTAKRKTVNEVRMARAMRAARLSRLEGGTAKNDNDNDRLANDDNIILYASIPILKKVENLSNYFFQDSSGCDFLLIKVFKND